MGRRGPLVRSVAEEDCRVAVFGDGSECFELDRREGDDKANVTKQERGGSSE